MLRDTKKVVQKWVIKEKMGTKYLLPSCRQAKFYPSGKLEVLYIIYQKAFPTKERRCKYASINSNIS